MAREATNQGTHEPAAFAAALKTSEPLVIVGGQAVNLWGLYYFSCTQELAPFVSRDLDVLGDRKILLRISETIGAKPTFFPMNPPTNEVGVVIGKGLDGEPLMIEVLSHVHGIKNDMLCEGLHTMLVNDLNVCVPSPISLLQAKLANVANIAQEGRQDRRHVLILTKLMPNYLADFLAASAKEESGERKTVKYLERLLVLVTKRAYGAILRDMNVSVASLFSKVSGEPGSPISNFLEKRLPWALQKAESETR